MPTVRIPCFMGRALRHTVFRGHISARELFPALWVDRFDEDDNPNGYQRPHDPRRSRSAAEYAEKKDNAFWSEAILNIRVKGSDREPNIGDPELGVRLDEIDFYNVDRDHPNFGVLEVEYDLSTKKLGGETVPWNRAFSVVDSQHRLFGLEDKDIMLPVCIFKGLGRKDEAVIFKDVNHNQIAMPTKLVDTILLKTQGHFQHPHIYISNRLHTDGSSPFFGHVDLGGKRVKGKLYFTTIEGLALSVQRSLKEYLDPVKEVHASTADREEALEHLFDFQRNYWLATKRVWPSAWDVSMARPGALHRQNPRHIFQQYKLLTSSGITALSRLAFDVLSKKCVPDDDRSVEYITNVLKPAKGFDWEKSSRDMAGVAGPGGGLKIYKALRDIVVPPTL